MHLGEIDPHARRIPEPPPWFTIMAMRITPWLVAGLLIFSAWRLYSTRDVEHSPGVLAADDPVQRLIDTGIVVERGPFVLRPRAEFAATVRVLRREDYALGDLAALAPTDFAVGWGPMSDSSVLEHIEISQANRFYFWRTETWPIDRRQIETHSANWHVIPGNDTVRSVLSGLRAGNLVELRGQLVDVEARDGGMRTSLTREDTGAGACEILLAASARLIR
jgi:hypothetical protein